MLPNFTVIGRLVKTLFLSATLMVALPLAAAGWVIAPTPVQAGATQPGPHQGKQYASEAKTRLEEARKIALRAFPGKIIGEELEREKGGSGLRYSFNIKKGAIVHEVGVDAMTGKVLENDPDSN